MIMCNCAIKAVLRVTYSKLTVLFKHTKCMTGCTNLSKQTMTSIPGFIGNQLLERRNIISECSMCFSAYLSLVSNAGEKIVAVMLKEREDSWYMCQDTTSKHYPPAQFPVSLSRCTASESPFPSPSCGFDWS